MDRNYAGSFSRIVTAFWISLAALAAPAQEANRDRPAWHVPIGSRVRISFPGAAAGPVVGTVAAIDATSISIHTKAGTLVSVPRDQIRSFDVSLEQRRNTIKGVAIGAAVGTLAGVLAHVDDCATLGASPFGVDALFCSRSEALQVFVTGGTVWGALFGYRNKGDRWSQVPLAELQLGSATEPRVALEGPPAPREFSQLRPPAQVAATGSSVYEGSRVRVLHQGRWTEGLLVGVSQANLTLTGSQGVVTIPRNSAARVETWGGEKRQFLKGVLVGGLLGIPLDFVDAPYCVQGVGGPKDCSRAASVAETALGGAAIGAIVGALVKKTTWVPVSLGDAPTSDSSPAPRERTWQVAPTFDRGAGLRFRLTW